MSEFLSINFKILHKQTVKCPFLNKSQLLASSFCLCNILINKKARNIKTKSCFLFICEKIAFLIFTLQANCKVTTNMPQKSFSEQQSKFSFT